MKCAWHSCLSLNKLLVRAFVVKLALLTPITAGGELPRADIYANGAKWTNENGETVSLNSLKGKKSLFALFYTTCNTICPMTAKSLKAIEKQLGPKAKDVQIVLVTIDPADQAPQLKKFVADNQIQGWKVLSGNSSAAKALAVDLGLGFEEKRGNPELHQMHSRTLVVVDQGGRVKGQLPIFEFELKQALALLR